MQIPPVITFLHLGNSDEMTHPQFFFKFGQSRQTKYHLKAKILNFLKIWE